MNKTSTQMFDSQDNELFIDDTIELITGITGKIVFTCGSYGVMFNDINYDDIQDKMDKDSNCCGNHYNGCLNDNFISLWELYWNFNCEDSNISPITKIGV